MDDGTAARLGDGHFLLTTTTAAAGEVMAHLEFCLQCLWPDLDVAGDLRHRAVGAGGGRRPALARAPERRPRRAGRQRGLPLHGLRRGRGRPGWRRGSSASPSPASTAYELAVPARYGAALWRPASSSAATRARRRPLRPRGAERPAHREGAPHPRRAARAHHRRRPRPRPHGRRAARTASARPAPPARRSPAPSASSSSACGPLDARGPPRRRRARDRARRRLHGRRTTSATSPPPATRRPSATTSRSASCGTAAPASARRVRAVCRLRGLDEPCEIVVPGLPRSGRGAAPWLSSRRKTRSTGLALPLAAGEAALSAAAGHRALRRSRPSPAIARPRREVARGR